MIINLILSALALFSLAWLISWRIQFYSLVDSVWAYSFGLGVFMMALTLPLSMTQWIYAGMVMLTSFRLGTHLTTRLWSHYPQEDRRYTELRKTMGPLAFYGFFMSQALSAILLSWPHYWNLAYEATYPIWEVIGLAVWCIGFTGEALADAQLRHFKKHHTHSAEVFRGGLWAYSRHPNYFFEWLIWLSYALVACARPWGFCMFFAPLTMGYLILFVTGIPPLEAQALLRKKESFLRYQEEVSSFFPGSFALQKSDLLAESSAKNARTLSLKDMRN